MIRKSEGESWQGKCANSKKRRNLSQFQVDFYFLLSFFLPNIPLLASELITIRSPTEISAVVDVCVSLFQQLLLLLFNKSNTLVWEWVEVVEVKMQRWRLILIAQEVVAQFCIACLRGESCLPGQADHLYSSLEAQQLSCLLLETSFPFLALPEECAYLASSNTEHWRFFSDLSLSSCLLACLTCLELQLWCWEWACK